MLTALALLWATPAAPIAAESEATEAEEKALTPGQIEGLEELALAKKLLRAGENATENDERTRNYEECEKHAARAVELLPENADAHFILFGAKGRVAQMGGLATAALALPSLNAELDEVLRLDPDHSDALAARGGMLMKLPRLMGGNTTEGVRLLERAVELNPTGAGTHLELAEAYEIVGRERDAYRIGTKAVTLAEKKGEAEKAERARAFVSELTESCSDCAAGAPASGE